MHRSILAVLVAALMFPAAADSRDRYPECHKPASSCKRIKAVHNECNTWACVKRVTVARERRERRRQRRLTYGLTTAYASWYGPGLYGNPLGCPGYGSLTTGTFGVAHKTLGCGTRVVLCVSRCVIARVVDRGPFVPGREFDLTRPVADAIGFGSTGPVRWKIAR